MNHNQHMALRIIHLAELLEQQTRIKTEKHSEVQNSKPCTTKLCKERPKIKRPNCTTLH
jgi:hypothetical protein